MDVLAVVRWPVGGIKTYIKYVYSCPGFDRFNLGMISPDYGMSEYLKESLSQGSIKYIPSEGGTVSLWKSVIRELRIKKYDLIHSHGFTAALISSPVSKIFRTQHLITAHDVFLKNQFQGWKGKVKYFVMRLALESADRIHAVSLDGRNNILEFFPSIDENKITVVLHGIDVEAFANAEPLQIGVQGYGPESECFVFGFLGRFMAQKGFRVLVDAVDLIVKNGRGKHPFRIATFGYGGYVREDYEYVNKKGLSEYFIQFPETNRVASVIKGLDAVVMPSRWEACGLLGMEVLTAGTPLIASKCIGLREVVENTPALQFEVDDVDGLADRMLFCMENASLVKAKAKGYMEIAKTRFNREASAQGLLEIYESFQPSVLLKAE